MTALTQALTTTPLRAALAGIILAAALSVLWLLGTGTDAASFTTFITRFIHVFAGMVWVGLIWFVNFVQLIVVARLDEGARAGLMREVAPRVAYWFRIASHVTLASGLILLVLTGYLLPSIMFGAGAFRAGGWQLLTWVGTAGGIIMWVLVNMVIWPNLKRVIGLTPADEDAKAQARAKVMRYARVNLLLSIPVTYAMVAAAHLS
ncbi:MAG: hypothetical protein AAFR04_09680 [Pseudomonadota bacterium]